MRAGTPCDRCACLTTNPPCLACGTIKCEPCFQFSEPCCSDMRHEDGYVPDMKNPTLAKHHLKANPHLKTILCIDGSCLTATTVSLYENRPTRTTEYSFCPKCGGPAEMGDYLTQQDFYERLARFYNLPTEIISELYPLWDKTKHTRFRSFVREYLREILK